MGLVEFAVGLLVLDFIHHLPYGQVKFVGENFQEIQITETA